MRSLTGKLTTSTKKKLHIEKDVAYHLGILKRGFKEGSLNADNMCNADETHFSFNRDNRRSLGLRGTSEVKCADAVSRGENITMIVRISGGKDACIDVLFLIFKNARYSYPIRGVPKSIPGEWTVKYSRNGLKTKWLSESCLVRGNKICLSRIVLVTFATSKLRYYETLTQNCISVLLTVLIWFNRQTASLYKI